MDDLYRENILEHYKQPRNFGELESPDLEAGAIAVPLRLRHEAGELSFISTVTTFGTALDVTVSELSIESFFAADAATAEVLRELSPRG